LIVIPKDHDVSSPWKKVASEIWNKFIFSKVNTKYVLYSIFNLRKEHEIHEEKHSKHGFSKIYLSYPGETINQLNAENIDWLLQTSKI
jgi:hypothetical protein